MNKQEKALNGLECCIAVQKYPDEYDSGCDKCPYRPIDAGTCPRLDVMLSDALELLKAQMQAFEPIIAGMDGHNDYGSRWYACGACGFPIDKGDRYCRHCGKAVLWGE